ncbi:MAG: hypothetical protein HY754_06100 [Nitrospirae bacterium]|nr:hypothetical protein [Nitrospirota bacterium]
MSSSNQGGYYSEWTFDGVQCEECHGPGLNHANSPSKDNITKNTSKDLCGKCHIRSTNTSGQDGECGGTGAILTNGAVISGDWISHHEQYNELVGLNNDGVHSSLDCTECHDPHKRSKKVLASVASALGITDNDKSAEERGAIKKTCEDCHLNVSSADTAATDSMRIAHKNNNVTCVDCHMAEATKSAINYSTSGWGRKADLKTHIFKIKPSGSGITRTNADGKNIATNYITPKYTCGKCHDSNIYGSVISGPTSESDAQSSADNYHGLQ